MLYFHHTREMYAQLPMKNVSILPDAGFPPRFVEIGNFMYRDECNRLVRGEAVFGRVWCKPKPAQGVRWGHRVMVRCDCGRDIPFGRMGQHLPACKAR